MREEAPVATGSLAKISDKSADAVYVVQTPAVNLETAPVLRPDTYFASMRNSSCSG